MAFQAVTAAQGSVAAWRAFIWPGALTTAFAGISISSCAVPSIGPPWVPWELRAVAVP
jgi:hypothetical protein